MSLERKGKSEANWEVTAISAGRFKSFCLGIAFGLLAAPMLFVAGAAVLPKSYRYTAVFTHDGVPDFGVSNMRFGSSIVEHVFVTPNFAMTREFTSREPAGVLTFDFRATRGAAYERMSIELVVEDISRGGCTVEVVLSAAGATSRGCLQPIKHIF